MIVGAVRAEGDAAEGAIERIAEGGEGSNVMCLRL